MAWLNIDRDLEYDYDPLVVVDCNMPFRAGKKELNDFWGYKEWETTSHGIRLYSFIHYVIENNIGKSFSNAFRYFCKFVKPYLQSYFLDQFSNYNSRPGRRYEKYHIENDIIIANEDRFKKWYSSNDKYFRTFDFEETWLLERTSTELHRNYIKQITKTKEVKTTYTETFRRGIGERYIQGFDGYYPKGFVKAVKLISQVGFKEKVDSKKSARYQKLKQEDDRRKKKQDREKERSKKQIVYSFLTRQEKELKEARKLDQYNLYRHGFDDESFKGKPYHGRKNKKQRREEARIQSRLQYSEM